jgi:excisionase family DNA binding protein
MHPHTDMDPESSMTVSAPMTKATVVAIAARSAQSTVGGKHPVPLITGLPKYAPIPRACDITGLGRSTIYKLAGNGTLRLVKAGNRTLVDIEHALAWMATLPVASIAPAHKTSA